MASNLVFSLQYTNEKSCSVQTDFTSWRKEQLPSQNLTDFDVVKLTTEDSKTTFFGLSPVPRKSQRPNAIFLNGIYATKIGLKNNSKVSAELLKNVSACVKAYLEPVTVDDWEILEINAQEVEGNLLDQIRVLWAGQVFPLWVSGSVCIFLRTVAIEPDSQCGVLMPLTELVIEPKINRTFADGEVTERKNIFSHRKQIENDPGGMNSLLSSSETEPTHIIPTVPNVDDAEERRRSLLQRLLHLSIFRRLVQLISYVFNILCYRVLPAILGPFSLFRAVPKAITQTPTASTLSDSALSSIKDFPHKFNLVLRVEPMHAFRSVSGQVSIMERFDEAGFALLNTANRKVCQCTRQGGIRICVCMENNPDFGIFLVGLKKLPTKKADENAPTPISGQSEKEVVIRLCVQSLSKFAMFFRSDNSFDDLSEEIVKSLKLSSVLRLQLEIGVTSRVSIRKLVTIPKTAKGNIERIAFQVLDAPPQSISQDDFRISFERWLKEVADEGNPLPLTAGSVFALPVRKFLSLPNNDMNLDSESEIIKILVSVEKVIDCEGSSSSEYYLITSQDLTSIEFEFTLKQLAGKKTLDDIDPKIPQESMEGLIPVQKTIVSSCLKHAEAVFRTKPIVSHLGGNTGLIHPGFVLLTGPSGTGRSHLSRVLLRKLAMSDENQAYVRWICCSNLKGKKPETIKKLLHNIVNELQWRQPSALLLDDIDNLLPSNTSVDGENSPSAVYTLQLAVIFKEILSQLCRADNLSNEVGKVFIIATALSEQAIHPVLLPMQGCYLFSKVLPMQLSDNNERKQLLRAIVFRNLPLERCLSKVDFGAVANITEGFSVKDFVLITKRATIFAKNRDSNTTQFSVTTKDFANAVTGYVPISLQDAKLHKPKKFFWSDVGGLRDVRKELMEKLVWPMKYAHLYQSAGMQLRSGILLYGPPGCGKTLLAGVVANECNLNFISVKGPELLSKYIGASEAAVRELFNRASAAAPCILFFDEFDSVAQKRGHDSTGVTDRVVNQILTHLDGVEPLSGVYVLAATSRPDLIDPAILRPGRLDTHLCCNMPDFEERCDILTCLLEKLSLADEINIRAIAAQCENFTGADLRALVYDAQLNALHSYAGSKGHHSENDGSILTLSSRSTTPTSIGMELDDGYDSNGMKSIVKDLKEEPSEPPRGGADVSINEITKTAAKLAVSIQRHKESGKTMKDEYRLCYGLSPPNLSDSASPRLELSPENVEKCSRIIYFPSLYSKTAPEEDLPETVLQLVSSVSKTKELDSHISNQVATDKHGAIKVSSYHFESVLSNASPSVSPAERQRYLEICRNFSGKGRGEEDSKILQLRMNQRATLA